jgi:hypothetical protein
MRSWCGKIGRSPDQCCSPLPHLRCLHCGKLQRCEKPVNPIDPVLMPRETRRELDGVRQIITPSEPYGVAAGRAARARGVTTSAERC